MCSTSVADGSNTTFLQHLMQNLSHISSNASSNGIKSTSPSGPEQSASIVPQTSCNANKSASASSSKDGSESWMNWFIEYSGLEGIKQNLDGSSKSKAKSSCNKKIAKKTSTDQLEPGTILPIIKKKRKSTPCVRRKIDHVLLPEEVTDEMLAKVAVKPKDKIHDQENGTSCHQCRQKTSDTKTICRSGKCVGLRGYFCGPCLRTRYGESASVALKDPKWSCPVCRGICNCSLCRKAFGHEAIGQIAQRLPKLGYSNVQEFLNSKKSMGGVSDAAKTITKELEMLESMDSPLQTISSKVTRENDGDELEVVEQSQPPDAIVGLQGDGDRTGEEMLSMEQEEDEEDEIVIENIKIEPVDM